MAEWKKNDYVISTDKSKLDLDTVYDFLSHSYWAEGISRTLVKKSIDHSLCFGIYHGQDQVGFARVVSDFATFAYLADVFVLPTQRNKGLAKWLMEVIMEHPDLQGLRRIALATRDAHELYSRYGFTPFDKPERWMQLHNPDVYKRKN